MIQHHHGQVVAAYAGVAFLTVLKAPVRVVVVGTNQVVGFLCGYAGSARFGGGSIGYEADTVGRVDFLFGRQEIAVAIVECAFHIAFLCPAARTRSCYSPVVRHHAGGVGKHGAVVVAAVGNSVRKTHPLAEITGACIDVGVASYARKAKRRRRNACPYFRVAGNVVQTAPGVKTRASGFHVVRLNTVYHYSRVLGAVTANAEARLAKVITG
ncbi:MAG: hypothetical protein BWY70_01116 [Bacteroidetes bacterium ADurb.Bin408]|nr:MAG: hypothetical protein BWY70_01116 [Bacteroidetes bacterium ADurb.Bin408]